MQQMMCFLLQISKKVAKGGEGRAGGLVATMRVGGREGPSRSTACNGPSSNMRPPRRARGARVGHHPALVSCSPYVPIPFRSFLFTLLGFLKAPFSRVPMSATKGLCPLSLIYTGTLLSKFVFYVKLELLFSIPQLDY